MEKLIKKHLKAEVMNTPEFREIETMVSYEKLVRIKNDEQRKRMMERQRYWASSYYWTTRNMMNMNIRRSENRLKSS